MFSCCSGAKDDPDYEPSSCFSKLFRKKQPKSQTYSDLLKFILIHPISEWKSMHVSSWIGTIAQLPQYSGIMVEFDIDGPKLLTMTNQMLKDHQIENESHRKELMVLISDLKKRQTRFDVQNQQSANSSEKKSKSNTQSNLTNFSKSMIQLTGLGGAMNSMVDLISGNVSESEENVKYSLIIAHLGECGNLSISFLFPTEGKYQDCLTILNHRYGCVDSFYHVENGEFQAMLRDDATLQHALNKIGKNQALELIANLSKEDSIPATCQSMLLKHTSLDFENQVNEFMTGSPLVNTLGELFKSYKQPSLLLNQAGLIVDMNQKCADSFSMVPNEYIGLHINSVFNTGVFLKFPQPIANTFQISGVWGNSNQLTNTVFTPLLGLDNHSPWLVTLPE